MSNWYASGELDMVMDSFEKTLDVASFYVGSKVERADRVEVTLENGRISKRYVANNYYNNGTVNQLFLMFMHGYASGKASV